MNRYQELWWRQARSDHDVLCLLRRQGAAACHQLHYLQMVTEKLGKAYFWRSGVQPPLSHAGFVTFMRALGGVPATERAKVAIALNFGRFKDFQEWARSVLPLAYAVERVAPTLAHDGPNPEYPWPRVAPQYSPVTFTFEVWTQLTSTGRGRRLIQVIDLAVEQFPQFA